jgi:hypothetical protein
MFQRSAETALQFFEKNPSLRSVADRQVSSAPNTRCLGGIIDIHTVQCRGQERTLRHPCLHFPWRRHFPSIETLNFHWERKELVSLIKLVENSHLDNLYSNPLCHAVSNAFSISKNTAAVDISLLKLKVTWSVSLIHNIVLWRARNPD